MTSAQTAPLERAEPASESLAWRVHLMRSQPERLPVILCAAVFSSWVAWLLFRSPLLALAAIFMVASATGEYLFVQRFRLTRDSVSCQYGANHFALEWSRVRRVLLYADGVRLSPLATASRLDAFRGVFLRFAPDGEPGDRESVLAAVARCRPAREEREEA